MVTIIEMAREIRHHIVTHSTGRLELRYTHGLRSIDFSGGTIVSDRDKVFTCFEEAPLDFFFLPVEIPPPDEFQSGATLLIEAMKSVGDLTLQRVWKPYKNWAILLPQDPDIHDTQVSTHMEQDTGRLRRMLRLAVSGALTLCPPVAKSINQEMEEIRAATGRGDFWQVLNITRSASVEKVKKAYRKRVRQFHPDRWYSNEDQTLKERVEGAFRDVHYCYEQALRTLPQRFSTVTTPPQANITPIVTRPTWTPPPKPETRPAAAHAPETAPRHQSNFASYTAFGKAGDPAIEGLFRQIFEKAFKAA